MDDMYSSSNVHGHSEGDIKLNIKLNLAVLFSINARKQ